MKKIVSLAVMIVALTACNDSKKQEKALKDEVLNFHEQVMADDEKAMINKMKLDTLIRKADSLHTDTMAISKLSKALVNADNEMSNWMSKVNIDYTNADHNQVIKYWQDQHKQVKQVDSTLVSATKASAVYINNIKK